MALSEVKLRAAEGHIEDMTAHIKAAIQKGQQNKGRRAVRAELDEAQAYLDKIAGLLMSG